jgi:hypothetical protein
MIDDQSPHDPSGVSHESSAVGKRRTLASRHVQVCLMQQGRGAKADGRARPRQFALGKLSQLGIKGTEKRVSGSRIALFGGANKPWNCGVRPHPESRASVSYFSGLVKTLASLAHVGSAAADSNNARGRNFFADARASRLTAQTKDAGEKSLPLAFL